MTKEFILETLLPYKQDPSNCAYANNNCLYLTKDGRKCAVGKHMKNGPWQKKESNIIFLVTTFSLEEMLTEEAFKQDISVKIWQKIQNYHDAIASELSKESINDCVKSLEELTNFKFPELIF